MTRVLAPLALLLALPLSSTARAAPVTLKLATLAPKDSRYCQLLEDMAQKWAEASGGEVKLRIYPGGVAGSEGDMVRKMGVGQLQAAAITVVGMHDISPEPQATSIPFLVETDGEMQYVLAKLHTRIDAALAAKGFVAVTWATAGSLRFFSSYPIRSPADLSNSKIWAWDGDPAAAEGWKSAGFHPVVLSSTDIVPSLQTGLINTVSDPPLFVFVTRMFEKAKYMLDYQWGMIAGSVLVRKEAWDKIPLDLQAKLLAVSAETGKALSAEVKHLDDDAIVQMKKQGLQIVEPTDLPAWKATGEKSWTAVRGKVVPAELFDEVKRLVAEYHAQHP